MSIVNQPVTKHKFEGIGETLASMVIAALAGNPSLVWLTAGFMGRVTFLGAKLIGMGAASLGLVFMNIGVEKVQTIVDQGNFDGTWESALRMKKLIEGSGRELTDAEKESIDAPVRDAFRKFGRFGRLRKR